MVNALVDTVFSYLADFTRHSEWDGDRDLKVTKTSPGPVSVGFTCQREGIREGGVGQGNVTYVKEQTVSIFVPIERLAFRQMNHDAEVGEFHVIDLKPVNGDTRITKVCRSSIPGWFWPIELIMLPLLLPATTFWHWLLLGRHLRSIKLRVSSMK